MKPLSPNCRKVSLPKARRAADGKSDEGKQSLEQGALQPSFKSVTGKGGIKVIDGSSVKFGRFDGAEPHCVGLTDLVTGDDGSSMAAGFMQWENAFFPWTLNYDEIDMVLEGAACSPRRRNYDRQSGRCDVYPERLQHRIWYDIQREIPVCRPPANWQSL